VGDIVERLRSWPNDDIGYDAKEAADEIERLRDALGHIAKQWPDSFAARTARAALKGDE